MQPQAWPTWSRTVLAGRSRIFWALEIHCEFCVQGIRVLCILREFCIVKVTDLCHCPMSQQERVMCQSCCTSMSSLSIDFIDPTEFEHFLNIHICLICQDGFDFQRCCNAAPTAASSGSDGSAALKKSCLGTRTCFAGRENKRNEERLKTFENR